MPRPPKPAPDATPAARPAHRPKALVTRDALIQMRTFQDLADRLDAMTLVRSRSSRANTIEFYLMRAVEADEQALGLHGETGRMPVPAEPVPPFESLSAPVRNAVLAVYARLGKKGKPTIKMSKSKSAS